MKEKIIKIILFLLLICSNFTLGYSVDNEYELYKITDAYDVHPQNNFNIKYLDYNKIEIFSKDWQRIDKMIYKYYYIIGEYIFCYFEDSFNTWGFRVYDKNYNLIKNLGNVKGIRKINAKYNQLDVESIVKLNDEGNEVFVGTDTYLIDNSLNLIKKFDNRKTICTIDIYEDRYLILSANNFIEIYNLDTFELLTTIEDINSYCYIVNDSLITQNTFLNNVPISLKGVYNFSSNKYSSVKYNDVSVINDYYLCTINNNKIVLDSNMNEVNIKIKSKNNNSKLINIIYNQYFNKYYFVYLDDMLNKYSIYLETGDLICETLNMPIEFISQTILVTKTNDSNNKKYSSFIAIRGNKVEVYDEKYFIEKSPIDNIYYLQDNEMAYVMEDKGDKQIVKISGKYDDINFTDDNKYFIINNNGKLGIMTLEGNIILEPIYEYIHCYENTNLFKVCKDDREMILTDSGKCVLESDHVNYHGDNIFSCNKGEGLNSFYTIIKDEPSSWAKYSISELNKLNIIPSQYNAIYKSNITREEFSEIIANLVLTVSDSEVIFDNKSKFEDIDSNAINLCSSLGLIKGKTNTMFYPNDYITREEIAVIINRVLDYIQQYQGSENKISFKDANDISLWAQQSVDNISSLGILVGDNNSNFKPKDNTTREQSYIIIYRILKLLNKI